MAYDKAIDSSVLDSNLLSIANAIREKAGLSDNFAFPQGFVEAISGISSGGDIKIATGSYVPSTEDDIKLEVEHGLGVVPNFFWLYSPDAEIIEGERYFKHSMLFCRDINDVESYIGVIKSMQTKTASKWLYSGSNNGNYLITANSAGSNCLIFMCDVNIVKFRPYYSSYITRSQAGKTYIWIVGVI